MSAAAAAAKKVADAVGASSHIGAHPQSAAARPTAVQTGPHTCRSCRGQYNTCSGAYGYRTVSAGWWKTAASLTDEDRANPDYLPESPNGEWYS